MSQFDPSRKFVRVTQLRNDGFVEFDFAVGEAEIYVEMILPAKAFDDFCEFNKVTFLDPSTSVKLDAPEGVDWRLSDVNTAFHAGLEKKPDGKQPA